MPTYDYECSSCGHRYELYQSITARPVKKCPLCGRSTARRLIGSGAGVIFRGSGFYETDYRDESYRKAAKAEAEAGAGGGGKDKSTETKASSEGKRKADGGTSTTKSRE